MIYVDKFDIREYDEKEHARRGIDRKHSYEEHSGNETFEDVVVYKEPSTYDNLLMALGSSSKFMVDVYQRRWVTIEMELLFGS
ncbi:hypothetical protein MRB53_008978 [Persea americana]|uniref:Uncharacterized protein n=1 Tax=Persea americana TaxID=3435 RepID=A0ACC2LMS1_PERAE|nr:hypothetical protein MRB53_008978 [Persea americana]